MEVLKDLRQGQFPKVSQVEGIDYNETFAPVTKMNSIHLILSLAALHNWEFHQMDVKYAFLHRYLEEDIYMEQPPGYVQNDSSLVYHLKKPYMALRKILELGIPRCIDFSLTRIFLDAILTPMSISRKQETISSSFIFKLMILFLLVVTLGF